LLEINRVGEFFMKKACLFERLVFNFRWKYISNMFSQKPLFLISQILCCKDAAARVDYYQSI